MICTKKIILAACAMTAAIFASCTNTVVENSLPEETTVSLTTPSATTTTTTEATSETTTEPPPTEVTTVVPTQTEIDEEALLSKLEQVDYQGGIAIPRVAWTEINLDKIMYTTELTFGYMLATPGSPARVVYDPGAEVKVIGRTSTEYYRISGDYYIPCAKLAAAKPEGIGAATSQTIAGVVTAATKASSWTGSWTGSWSPKTTTTQRIWWSPTATTAVTAAPDVATKATTAKTWWTPPASTAVTVTAAPPVVTTAPVSE